MGTSSANAVTNQIAENRRAQLRAIANTYFEGLAKKDLSRVPWDENVTLRSPLAPGGLDSPLQGKPAVLAWFAGLYPVLGEVKVIEHYINEAMTAICSEALVGITSPPVTLRVIDRLVVNPEGKIVDQENHYDPRPVLQQSAKSADEAANIVDEASEESFPASDPPAY
jgi:hypothetical protein